MPVLAAVPLRRLRRVAAALALVVVVLGLGVVASSARVRTLAGGGCAAADTAHVGLVVDFGSLAGAPSPSVQTFCEPFTPGMTGADLLATALGGPAQLRWATSGLLCGIAGYPATGCGVRSGTDFQYWSYWHGGSTWAYANDGPAAHRLSAGAVEGWRFVSGSDSASEPGPRSAATGPCPPPTPTTTPAVSSTVAPAAGGGGSSAARPPAPSVSGRGTPTTVAAGGSSASTVSPTSTAPVTTSAGSGGSGRPVGSGAGAPGHRQEALGGRGTLAASPGRGSPVGSVIVVALIAALVVVSVLVRRRRRPA